MSIKHSIARCRKPIATGSSRQVFYSKKYNVIIKVPYLDGWLWHTAQRQTQKEYDIFQSMNKKEQKLFPIIEFIESKNNVLAIIMKKAVTLYDLNIEMPTDHFEYMSITKQRTWLTNLKKQYGIKVSTETFIKVVEEWGLRDLHLHNLGVCENRLVILDFGW